MFQVIPRYKKWIKSVPPPSKKEQLLHFCFNIYEQIKVLTALRGGEKKKNAVLALFSSWPMFPFPSFHPVPKRALWHGWGTQHPWGIQSISSPSMAILHRAPIYCCFGGAHGLCKGYMPFYDAFSMINFGKPWKLDIPFMIFGCFWVLSNL